MRNRAKTFANIICQRVGRSNPRRLTLGPVSVAVAVVLSVGIGACGSPTNTANGSIQQTPPPNLASLIPVSQHVVREQDVDLDGTSPTLVDVTSASRPNVKGGSAQRLLVLAWDAHVKRWRVVFDSATATWPSSVSLLDSPDGLPEQNAPTYSSSHPFDGISEIHVDPLRDVKGSGDDLVFWGTSIAASGTPTEIGIVHYNGRVATLAWTYRCDSYATVSVIGDSPHQRVSVTSGWNPPFYPVCCAVRAFHFIVGRSEIVPDSDTYIVENDNRSWLGVWVTPVNSTDPESVEVASVVPGSPAANVLQPGDVLEDVEGPPVLTSSIPIPPVVGELASHFPGQKVTLDILRNGTPMTVSVVLGSKNSVLAANTPVPSPGYLGVSVANSVLPPSALGVRNSNPAGALITDVEPGSPAALAGLSTGDAIVFLEMAVASVADYEVGLTITGANTPAVMAFVNSTGVHDVTVTLAYPTPSEEPALAMI